jgi:hypothetical protein
MISNTKKPKRGNSPDETACICCGTLLPSRHGYCFSCQTPSELSRSVAARDNPPRFVSVIGASGAGKTVFLGLLMDMLTKGAGELRGLANGTFSVAVQAQTVTALEGRKFPEKTPSEAEGWQWVHCEVCNSKRPKKNVDIITPDFAGEAIALEVDQPGMYPAIRSVIAKSLGILILCDSLKVRDEGLSEDLFVMKLASYVHQRYNEKKNGRGKSKMKSPVAIVFTKCDWCQEALDDPRKFANNNTPRLLQFCEQSFGEYRFFGASVVGASGIVMDRYGRHMQIPLHIEPHGVTEPLEWIMKYN